MPQAAYGCPLSATETSFASLKPSPTSPSLSPLMRWFGGDDDDYLFLYSNFFHLKKMAKNIVHC